MAKLLWWAVVLVLLFVGFTVNDAVSGHTGSALFDAASAVLITAAICYFLAEAAVEALFRIYAGENELT